MTVSHTVQLHLQPIPSSNATTFPDHR